jgi:hypothetical protein
VLLARDVSPPVLFISSTNGGKTLENNHPMWEIASRHQQFLTVSLPPIHDFFIIKRNQDSLSILKRALAISPLNASGERKKE